jgi:(p)ppGpp synthase/HD superfamily hydrolase
MNRTIELHHLVEHAAQLARHAHEGQFRRDGVTPYIRHAEAVASRLGDDPVAQAVAWLHDVLEDTPTTEADLRRHGVTEEVIAAVALLTKREGLAYESYLAAVKANPLARRVKIADMLSNLADSPTDKQIVKYAQGLLYLMGGTGVRG